MNQISQIELEKLESFIKWVDISTYILDGQRYYRSDKKVISPNELAYIFLDSDANPKNKPKLRLM